MKENVSFVRFMATDEVELQGWPSDVTNETAILHVHGKTANEYEKELVKILEWCVIT